MFESNRDRSFLSCALRAGVVCMLWFGLTLLVACSRTACNPTTGAALVSLSVSPNVASIAAGSAQQFVVTAVYSDGTKLDLPPSQVTWSSSNTAAATIGTAGATAGLAATLNPGSTTITATYGGVSVTTALTVTAATLLAIEVTPANGSVPAGLSNPLVATGVYSNNTTQDLTNLVTWSSAAPTIAAVSNTAGSRGVVTAQSPGTTAIAATLNGVSGSTMVTATAATLVSIQISGGTSLAKGSNRQLTATGDYSDGSTHDLTNSVTWSSTAPQVGTVSSAGLASAVAPGTTTVGASLGGVTGSETLTVTAATLVSIGVTPSNTSVPRGNSTQFTAIGTYSDNSTQNLANSAVWSSSSSAVAPISNASGSSGLAMAAATGTTTISATFGGVTGSTAYTVTAATLQSIQITESQTSIADGTTEGLTATGFYSDGTTRDLTASVVWGSSMPTIATVSNAAGSNGVADADSVGSTTLTATLGGVSAMKVLSVTAATLQSIAVTPANPSIANGTTQQFTATGIYSDNTTQDLTASVTWTSSSAAIASISNASGSNGLATGAAVGSVTVTAKLGSINGSTPLAVTAATLVSMAVTPTSTSIANGTTQQFAATGTYSDGSTHDLTSSVTWGSSNGATAAISNASGSNGLANGTGVGSTTISATLGGISGSTPLTVTSATLVSIAVTPSGSSIAKGSTQQFTATGTYSDHTTQNLTSSVTWNSSNAATASISNASGSNGLATGSGVGSTTISATLGSISGSTPLSVTSATLTSIAVTPANRGIANGTTQQFTATGTYSDSTTQNLTAAVTWASSSSAIASISNASGSNGLATAAAVGSTTISATLGSVSGSTSLAVSAATLVSIAVTPSNTSIANGTTQQFAATGTYSDGSIQNLTTAVTWASSSSTASISNASGSNGLATGAAVGSTTISATLGSVSGSTPLAVSAATLVSIAVTPGSTSIAKGSTQQFTATGSYSDGSTQDLTASATWSSSNGATASISNASGSNGLATGAAVGSTTVSATVGGVSGSTPLNVSAATLVSLAITPPNPSIADGTSEQFTATGIYSDNSTQDLTTAVNWTSSAPANASISNAQGSNGLATGAAVGTTTIGASLNGVSAATGLNVTAATLVSIAVTPTNQSIPNGTTEQFTATGTYSDGSTQNLTTAVSWSSSTPGTASISNASGSKGLATASAQGSTTITATLGGISGTTPLTVTPATLVSIGVTPPNPSIANGTSTSFTATGIYSDGTTQNLTTAVDWSSSSTTVATISNASGSNGLATSTGQGSTTISAALGGISGTATLTVTPATLVSIGVTPPNTSAPKGTSQQFTATGVYSDNSTQNLTAQVTWSSSSTAVATISNASSSKGLAAGAAVGNTTVTAVLGTLSGSTGFTVTPAVLTSIAVTPTNPSVADGLTQQFMATGTYTDNTTQNITSAVTWSSSPTGVASISNASGSNGLGSTQSVGSTTISAASGSISGSTGFTVTPATLVSIAVTPANQSIADGTTEQYIATGTYTDGTTKNLTSTVTWSSSSPTIAPISNAAGSNGLATSTAQGSTTITATLGSVSGSTALSVTPATLVSIAVTPANQSIANGTSQQYTAIGTYTDGSTQNLTTAVAWTSSANSVASISNAAGSKGLASSAAQGSSTITAGLGAITGSTLLTVTAAALTSISVTPATATVNVGATQQYVATGHYTDGSTHVLTTTVTWSSSNTADAAVSNASGSQGLATGTGAGMVTITATAAPGSTAGSAALTVVQPYAYVLNSSSNTVAQYAIGASGALTATGTPLATDNQPFFEVIDATNQYLYEVNIQGNSIGQYSIGTGGALTLIQTTATGTNPNQPVIDKSGKYVYVSNQDGTISEYSIGSNGALTSIGSVSTGILPFGIDIEPGNKYLYAVNNLDQGSQGTISEYSIGSNGVLSLIGTVVADGSPGVDKIAVEPTGQYAYVTNSTSNVVEEFTIASNGQLTKFGSIGAGAYARSIAFDKSGTYVYVVNSTDKTISEYSIGANGALTSIGTVSTGSGSAPFDITLDSTGKYFYVPVEGNNTVVQFSVGSNGTLTLVGNFATGSNTSPSGVATTH